VLTDTELEEIDMKKGCLDLRREDLIPFTPIAPIAPIEKSWFSKFIGF
jgi:hypothetical protein